MNQRESKAMIYNLARLGYDGYLTTDAEKKAWRKAFLTAKTKVCPKCYLPQRDYFMFMNHSTGDKKHFIYCPQCKITSEVEIAP